MTRRTVLAAFTAFAVTGASGVAAQTIGFKAGAAFADWSADVVGLGLGTDGVTSFMGGGFVRFDYGQLSVQPELLVVTRGTGFDAGDFAGVRYRVDYAELPVLLVLRLARPGAAGPYFFAGPSLAFKIACKAEVESGGVEVSGDCADLPDAGLLEAKGLDAGLTGGAGVEFPLGPGAVLVEGRFNWGLTDLSDFPGLEVRSRTGAVLAGYSIPLGMPRR